MTDRYRYHPAITGFKGPNAAGMRMVCKKTSFFLFLLVPLGGFFVFSGLFGLAPTSGDALWRVTCQDIAPWDTVLSAMPEGRDGVAYHPASSLVAFSLSCFLPPGSPFNQAAAFVVLLGCALLLFRVTRRFLGTKAAAAASVVYVVHPLHTGFFTSLAAGLEGGIHTLLILAALDTLNGWHADLERSLRFETGRKPFSISWKPLFCILAAAAATFSSGNPGIPLLVLLYDLFAAGRGGEMRRPAGRKALHAAIWIVAFAAVAARIVLILPFPAVTAGFDTFSAPLAAPFVASFASDGASRLPGSAAGPALAFLLAVMLLYRLRLHGSKLLRFLLQALCLFVSAAAFSALENGPAGLEAADLGPATASFSIVLAVVLAGPAPEREERFCLKSCLPAVAATAAAAASLALLCLDLVDSVKEGEERSLLAAERLEIEIKRTDARFHYLYNEPFSIDAGGAAVAEFLNLELALGPILTGGEAPPPSIFPIQDHPALGGDTVYFLAALSDGAAYRANREGRVTRLLTKEEKRREIICGMALDLPRLITLQRNGFPVKYTYPVKSSLRERVVILTRLGPSVVEDFEDRIRLRGGRVEVFINDRRGLRNSLRLFNGGEIRIWVEVFRDDGKLLTRSFIETTRLFLNEESR